MNLPPPTADRRNPAFPNAHGTSCRLIVAFALLVVLPAVSAREEGFRKADYRQIETAKASWSAQSTLPRPDFPLHLRRQYAQASILLRVYVSELGRIDHVEVFAVAGNRELADHTAAFARANWKAPVVSVRGKPVKYFRTVPVTFVVEGGLTKLNAAIRALNHPGIKELAEPARPRR